jgi:hypothetical protein
MVAIWFVHARITPASVVLLAATFWKPDFPILWCCCAQPCSTEVMILEASSLTGWSPAAVPSPTSGDAPGDAGLIYVGRPCVRRCVIDCNCGRTVDTRCASSHRRPGCGYSSVCWIHSRVGPAGPSSPFCALLDVRLRLP